MVVIEDLQVCTFMVSLGLQLYKIEKSTAPAKLSVMQTHSRFDDEDRNSNVRHRPSNACMLTSLVVSLLAVVSVVASVATYRLINRQGHEG
jgi:hypothetical protein